MTTSGYLRAARRRLLHELLIERFGPTRTAWREQPYRNKKTDPGTTDEPEV